MILSVNYPALPDDENPQMFFEEAFSGGLAPSPASLYDSKSDVKSDSKSAFKNIKRSVDIPFEYWAILQTLVDLNDGAFSFNTALGWALRHFASSFAWNAIENDAFMRLYQIRIDERLKCENEALYKMLSSQDKGVDSDV
jgi:hypothetical protein